MPITEVSAAQQQSFMDEYQRKKIWIAKYNVTDKERHSYWVRLTDSLTPDLLLCRSNDYALLQMLLGDSKIPSVLWNKVISIISKQNEKQHLFLDRSFQACLLKFIEKNGYDFANKLIEVFGIFTDNEVKSFILKQATGNELSNLNRYIHTIVYLLLERFDESTIMEILLTEGTDGKLAIEHIFQQVKDNKTYFLKELLEQQFIIEKLSKIKYKNVHASQLVLSNENISEIYQYRLLKRSVTYAKLFRTDVDNFKDKCRVAKLYKKYGRSEKDTQEIWCDVLKSLSSNLVLSPFGQYSILSAIFSDAEIPDIVWQRVILIISEEMQHRNPLYSPFFRKQLLEMCLNTHGDVKKQRLESLLNLFPASELQPIIWNHISDDGEQAAYRLVFVAPNILVKTLQFMNYNSLVRYFNTEKKTYNCMLSTAAVLAPEILGALLRLIGEDNFIGLLFDKNIDRVPRIINVLKLSCDGSIDQLKPLFMKNDFAVSLIKLMYGNQNIIQIILLNSNLSWPKKEYLLEKVFAVKDMHLDILFHQDSCRLGLFSFTQSSAYANRGYTALHYIAAYAPLSYIKKIPKSMWLKSFAIANGDNMTPMHCALALNENSVFQYFVELLLNEIKHQHCMEKNFAMDYV